MLNQLPKEGRVGIGQKIVEADAAADEDLLDAGNGAETSQQVYIILMIGAEIFTRLGEKALLFRAGTLRELLFAGRGTEVGGRAADVVDIALEIGVVRHFFGLGKEGGVAPRLDNAPLMEGQCAERAAAEAAAVRYQ